jgi:hypothetical protein
MAEGVRKVYPRCNKSGTKVGVTKVYPRCNKSGTKVGVTKTQKIVDPRTEGRVKPPRICD